MINTHDETSVPMYKTFFGRTILGMVLIWFLIPIARQASDPDGQFSENEKEVLSTPQENRFHYRDETESNTHRNSLEIVQQLDRHARNMSSGFYESVAANPSLPPEIKRKFLQERDRLAAMAAEHHETARQAQTLYERPAAFSLNPAKNTERQTGWAQMERRGVLDEMNAGYLQSLHELSNAADLPENERPDPAFIQEVAERRLIPVL